MATIDELPAITRTLNRVETAGQARAAIGAALKALSKGYPLADRLSRDLAASARRELDSARVALEGWYRQIEQTPAAATFTSEWAKKRSLVQTAYVVIAGVEGAAGHTAGVSLAGLLADAIVDVPRVVGSAVGSVGRELGKGVGETAGSLVGGLFGGLGPSGLLVVVIAAAALIAFRKGLLQGVLP